jgi:two-component system sensor histidine kinase/response regulator
MLRKLGCVVEIAGNAEAAVQRFTSGSYDLILMDCEMPVMDGLDATRRIRQLESEAGANQRLIPILASTARSWSEVRAQCKGAGMDDFVVKPFDGTNLCEMLQRWLRADGEARPVVNDDAGQKAANVAPSILDPAALEAIHELGADELVKRVVGQYLESAALAVSAIAACLGSGDGDGAWRAAHKLKSGSETLGAQRLSAHCAEIERLSRGSGAEAARPLLVKLKAEYADVLAAFGSRAQREAYL